MDKILALFNFENTTWLVLAERFGLTLILSFVLFLLVAFIFILARKKKFPSEIPFSISFMQSFLWSILIIDFLLVVDVYFISRVNGGYYFTLDALSWSFFCGWINLLPELFILIIWITLFFWIANRMKKHTKF